MAEPTITPDDGPENLTLRYLRALDERLTRLETTMQRGFEVIAGRLAGIEGRLLGLETRMTALEDWSSETTQRLERIERRLGLVEEPTP
jgi:hypothetical protein